MRPVDVVVVFLFGAACAAAGLTMVGPACGQTLAVDPLPPAGYIGIDTTRAAAFAAAEAEAAHAAKAARRSQAQQAADRRTRERLARLAPAAGEPGRDRLPHVLWILRRTEQTTRTPLKHPTPAAPGTVGAGGPGGAAPLALVMTSEMSAITHQEFGDRGACQVSLDTIADHVDPDDTALYCLPLRTR